MQVSDAQLIAGLAEFDRLLDSRPGRYVMVMDNRHSAGLTASQRGIIAENNKRNEMRARARSLGAAFVMSSGIVRGIMTAVFWIKKPAVETVVFDDLEEALSWAKGRLAAASRNSIAPSAAARP